MSDVTVKVNVGFGTITLKPHVTFLCYLNPFISSPLASVGVKVVIFNEIDMH
jgi:predicted ATP-binding protein involved in virulence